MNIHRAFATFGLLSIGVFAVTLGPAFAAASPPAMQAATGAGSATTNPQMQGIDTEVRRIEQALPTLTRHEVMLQSNSLAGVTNVKWTKLHTYSSGTTVERMKLYPPAGSSQTEEFYYRGGKLIQVFREPNGADHEGHSPDAKGTRYYFDANGLFAVNDGRRTTTSLDAEQRAMGAKLQRESAAMLALAGK